MSAEVHRVRWSRRLAGIAVVAVVGGGLGAFFGIRAVVGTGSAPSGGQPPARTAAAMAYDATNGSVVLFGGQSRSHGLDDTWIWDGSGWTEAHPATSPPPLDSPQMTYDPVSHDVLLVGRPQIEGSNIGPIACSGGSGSASSGSSGSSGATTTFVPPAHPIPAIAPVPSTTGSAKRATPMGAPACGTMVVPKDATWQWNGSDWSKTSGSTPSIAFGNATLATDPVTGRAVLLARGPFAEPALGVAQSAIACPMQGARTPIVEPACPVLPAFAPAWTWNGHQWKEMASQASTSSLQLLGTSIIDDAVSGRLATFGGNAIAPTPAPKPCIGCVTGLPAQQSVCCTGAVSTWTGTSWKQIATYENGPVTSGATFVGDPATHSDVALNGDGQTWLWTGSWKRAHLSTTPPIVSGAASAYDAGTGQVLMFGGFGATSRETGLYDQTWTWDGADWMQRGGSSGPSVAIPIPSPASIPPGPPCKPVPPLFEPDGTPAAQPHADCSGIIGSGSGSTGATPGVATGSGVVAP